MSDFIYLNGEIIGSEKAVVGVHNIGLLRGFGIYEAMTTHNGKAFMFDLHLTRFKKTANFMGIRIPATDEEIKTAVQTLILKNSGPTRENLNIKFILTGGETLHGIDYDERKPTFYIFSEKFVPISDDIFKNGAKVVSHKFLRQYPEYKTTNYIEAVKCQKKQNESNALETLYTFQGKILECATSNFFIVKDDVLITPDQNVLKGITRKIVLDLARQNNIKFVLREISLDELKSADEALLSASFKEIVPVTSVDDFPIGNGKVGPITRKLFDLFTELALNY